MMWKGQDGRPGAARALHRSIEREIVDYEDGHAGDMLVNRTDDPLDRPFLVPGRHDHKQGFRTLGADQSAANLLVLMEWLRTRRWKIRRVIRARSRISRRCRRNRAAWRKSAKCARTTYQAIRGPAFPSARKRAALPRPSSRYRACHRYRAAETN